MDDNLTMSFFCLQTFSGLPLLLAVTGYGYHGYYCHSALSDVVPASFCSLIFYCSQLYLNIPYTYLSVSQISLPLGPLTCYFLCLEHTPLLSNPSSQKSLCPWPGQLLPTHPSGYSLRATFHRKPFQGTIVQHLWFTHLLILVTSSVTALIMLCANCLINCLTPWTDLEEWKCWENQCPLEAYVSLKRSLNSGTSEFPIMHWDDTIDGYRGPRKIYHTSADPWQGTKWPARIGHISSKRIHELLSSFRCCLVKSEWEEKKILIENLKFLNWTNLFEGLF